MMDAKYRIPLAQVIMMIGCGAAIVTACLLWPIGIF